MLPFDIVRGDHGNSIFTEDGMHTFWTAEYAKFRAAGGDRFAEFRAAGRIKNNNSKLEKKPLNDIAYSGNKTHEYLRKSNFATVKK